jgi:DNA-binding transcriptional regulator PaaX
MSILELYQRGIINYLYQKGLLSSSTMAYVEYYKRFKQERCQGAGYRESVRRISKEFGVSETTVKKAVRLMREQGDFENTPTVSDQVLSLI